MFDAIRCGNTNGLCLLIGLWSVCGDPRNSLDSPRHNTIVGGISSMSDPGCRRLPTGDCCDADLDVSPWEKGYYEIRMGFR